MVAVYESLPSLVPGSNINFETYEAESSPELTTKYNVTVVPTFILQDANGKVVGKIETPDPAKLSSAVLALAKSWTKPFAAAVPVAAKSREDAASSDPNVLSPELKAKLERVVNSSTVMLFMKGNPTTPRCGFSRQVVEILNSNAIPFSSFDILNPDEQEVRSGLKIFSDWPTFPQLYVRGEMVGGLDILKEMVADGVESGEDLASQLEVEKEQSIDERVIALTKRSKIMVFMKGLPSGPKCGFSRQIVEIMNNEDVEYDAFNILEDDDVRQNLKRIADWPTYPQVWVDGELLGGLDVIKEMVEAGELSECLV